MAREKWRYTKGLSMRSKEKVIDKKESLYQPQEEALLQLLQAAGHNNLRARC